MWSLPPWLSGLVNCVGSCIVPGCFYLGSGGQLVAIPVAMASTFEIVPDVRRRGVTICS